MGLLVWIKSLSHQSEYQSNSTPPMDSFNQMYDKFTPLQARLDDLWKNHKIEDAIALGESMVAAGDKIPTVFYRMAIIYRSQKRYQDEIRILKIGIQAQIDLSNTGVAKKDFETRLKRVQELLLKSK